MNEDREGYEYHLALLLVRMRVKFPCKMKIEHNGNLMTAQIPYSNNENKYIFNQDLILKSGNPQTECFQFILHLVTDKGARYIGGVVKLYHSEMIRSEGEKLTLSLSKCVDTQAFCEIRVNQILTHRESRNSPYDRKSSVVRNAPSFKPKEDPEISPYKNSLYVANQQSKSQYHFPTMYQSTQKQEEWDNRTKFRHHPPSNNSRIRTPSKYTQAPMPQFYGQQSEIGAVTHERVVEAEAYKQGYQKLKQKYKREADISKQELNKRLALQSSENNLKLEVVRLRLRLDEQDKMLNEKSQKVKELQNSLTTLKQREGESNYLYEELKKNEVTIQTLENTISSMTADLTELRDLSRNKSTEESYKLRELKVEVQNLRLKLESREKELEHQSKIRKEILFEKDHEIAIKQEQIDRNRKLINDLEKGVQAKNVDLQKMLQNDRSTNRSKIEEQKSRIEKLQRQVQAASEEKREYGRKVEELKAANIKLEYEKRLLNQEFDSLQEEGNEYKSLKEKYNQQMRQNKNLIELRSQLENQIERLIQSKENEVITLSQQIKQQNEYFLTMTKEMEEKERKQSTEIVELESKVEQSKSQQEKLKKNVESLSREVEEYKEREKNAKKALKNREQQGLGIETQYATLKQKIKTIDHVYKLQADKIKEEAEKYRKQFEDESKKSADLANSQNLLSEELSRTKVKLQYAEQRSQRDSNNLKEKQQQIENLFKDSHEQIADLQKTLTTLRASEKDLTNKLQRVEVEAMRKDEKLEKAKRQLKVFEQKCNNFQSAIKGKNYELEATTSEKQFLQAQLAEKQVQFNELQSQHLSITTQKSKLSKINTLLEENLNQSKEETAKYMSLCNQKERKEIDLLNISKQEKEDFIKLQFAFNSLRKDCDRNKDIINENLQKYIAILLQNKEDESRIKKTKDNTFSEIGGLIVSYGKQLKLIISKLNDDIKLLQKDKDRLQQQLTNSASRAQNMEASLNNNLCQLEEELEKIYGEKETENRNFTIIINQLNQKLKEKDYLEEELNTQIEELNFTINSIKLDCEASNEQNTKRMSTLRKINLQWEEKVENLLLTTSILEQKNRNLDEESEALLTELQNQRQLSQKREKWLEDLKLSQESSAVAINQLKKKNKELVESLTDSEMYLTSEKEMNQKLRESIEAEERTCSELKAFVAELMKQKETAIKNDLEKNQSMTHLEASFLEQAKNNEFLLEENQKLSRLLQSQKEISKKYALSVKELEVQLRQEAGSHLKTQQKLKQSQREALSKEEAIKRLEQKYEKLSERTSIQVKDLQEELSQKMTTSSEQSKESSEKIAFLQGELQKRNSEISTLWEKANNFEEELFTLNQKYMKIEEMADAERVQNEELKVKIHLLDNNLNELSDEIKEREEKLFQYSGKNYSLELKLDAKDNERRAKLEEVNNDWNNKFEAICEEYEQRVELVEKERDYFKALSDDRDKEVTKIMNYLKSVENSENSTRKSFEQQLKKQEEEKLFLVSSKNNEIQKISEQIRSTSEVLKLKQSQLRRTFNELDIARKTIANFDLKCRESDEKAKNMVKLYQAEIDQLKKKETISKSLKESFSNHLWNSQRETKKSIQGFIRSFLEVTDDKNSQKVIEQVRSLQNAIIEAMAFNFNQK